MNKRMKNIAVGGVMAIVAMMVMGAIESTSYTPLTAECGGRVEAYAVVEGTVVTAQYNIVVLTSTGVANDETNTITLANPETAGRFLTCVVDTDSTNLVTIADSGNVAMSGAWVGDCDDSITFVAVTTGLWVEVSESDN